MPALIHVASSRVLGRWAAVPEDYAPPPGTRIGTDAEADALAPFFDAEAAPEPPPPAFRALSPAEFFILLLTAFGKTEADVEAQLAAIGDPQERAVALIYLRRASVFERAHPLVAQVMPLLGLDPAAVDAAWPKA